MRIVYENIYFALGIKAICLILGALGIANMWMAIFADVGVMVIAVSECNPCIICEKLIEKAGGQMAKIEEGRKYVNHVRYMRIF